MLSERTPAGRARLGLVLPGVNVVMEAWAQRVLPDGVSLHTARMLMPDALTPENVCRMDSEDGMRAVRQVASCRPHAIAYGCTASSIVQGLAYDAHLREEMAEAAHVPATTAAHAIISGLEALGAGRITVVSPYTEEIDQAEHRYFAGAGLDVRGGACLGIRDNFGLSDPSPRMLYDLGRRGWAEGAEALVITCLNTPSHTVIAALERDLGRPVVTSTQATLWHLLRLTGIKDRVEGFGRLLTM